MVYGFSALNLALCEKNAICECTWRPAILEIKGDNGSVRAVQALVSSTTNEEVAQLEPRDQTLNELCGSLMKRGRVSPA